MAILNTFFFFAGLAHEDHSTYIHVIRVEWSAYFSDDERLAVLQPSFQREPPRRAPTQLDLNVVERHELFNRFHSLLPVQCIGVFSPLFRSSALSGDLPARDCC